MKISSHSNPVVKQIGELEKENSAKNECVLRVLFTNQIIHAKYTVSYLPNL